MAKSGPDPTLSASLLTAFFLTTWQRRERTRGGEMCRSQNVEGAGPGFGKHVGWPVPPGQHRGLAAVELGTGWAVTLGGWGSLGN